MTIKAFLLCSVLLPAAGRAQTFEVASVKQFVQPGNGSRVFAFGRANPIQISGNRVTLRLATLVALVGAAYDVKGYQVEGGPAWAGSDFWDIEAKAPGDDAVTTEQARVMLQNLLAERFHLKLRHETKEIAVYNLVVAKGGVKMKAVPADMPRDPKVQRMTMEQIVNLASTGLDRPLIDRTGLTGELEANWNLGQMDLDRRAAPDAVGKVGVVLASLEDSLGLKAEAVKERTETLVIESAERPDDN